MALVLIIKLKKSIIIQNHWREIITTCNQFSLIRCDLNTSHSSLRHGSESVQTLPSIVIVHENIPISASSHCQSSNCLNSKYCICSFHLANCFKSRDNISQFNGRISTTSNDKVLHIHLDAIYCSFMYLTSVNFSSGSHVMHS